MAAECSIEWLCDNFSLDGVSVRVQLGKQKPLQVFSVEKFNTECWLRRWKRREEQEIVPLPDWGHTGGSGGMRGQKPGLLIPFYSQVR